MRHGIALSLPAPPPQLAAIGGTPPPASNAITTLSGDELTTLAGATIEHQ